MTEAPTATVEAVVIGAGAAGLAAAAELSRHGLRVALLEARARLGGRIHTVRDADNAVPIELGAEFVHGRPGATLSWLERARCALIDAPKARAMLRGRELKPAGDLFAEMQRQLRGLKPPEQDLPLASFLEGTGGGRLSARSRELARMLVEGFDAADAARVSTLSTLAEWSGASAADASTFRPARGYAALIETLSGALDRERVQVLCDTVVRELRWRREEVAVETLRHGEPFLVRAPRAIVTLPLGVLQRPPSVEGAVRFVPALEAKQGALAGLGVGPVVKLVLRFRHAFWESAAAGGHRDMAFFHAPRAPFPTFWTLLPTRVPLLVAWAAGPNAARASRRGESGAVIQALDTLETLFGRDADVRRLLEAVHVHDWQADPYARGAYSYVLAGGQAARAALAEPLEQTLFFAGEAADTSGESGTVAGALQSGERAARELLARARA